MQQHDASITVILAIGAAVWPVIFGFALWQLSKVFVSKESFTTYVNSWEKEFHEYKSTAENDRRDMRMQIANVGEDVKILLQRTAKFNHDKESHERAR